MIKEPRLRTLLTQADRNASYGKNAAAESIYRQILEEAPDAEEAWAGLAGVVADPEEKRAAYERALALSPDFAPAVAGLARLDGRPVPSEIETVPAPEEDVKAVVEPVPPAASDGGAGLEATHGGAGVYELVCYRHPDRSTSLRCYNCNRPICISCARKTPVGYICPECQREAEDAFYNNKPLDYVVATLVSLPISLLAGYLIGRLTGSIFFFLLIFFVSGAIGSFIGRVTKRAVGGRRGRYLPALVVTMMIVGAVLPALLSFLMLGGINLFGWLGIGIYLFVGAGAAYWQMR